MSKVKIKEFSKKISGMLGGLDENLDPVKSYDKYLELRKSLKVYFKELELLSILCKDNDLQSCSDSINKYLNLLLGTLKKDDEVQGLDFDVQKMVNSCQLVSKEKDNKDKFIKAYSKFKNSKVIFTILNTCKNFSDIKDTLNTTPTGCMATFLSLTPFTDLKLNLIYVYNNLKTQDYRETLVKLLNNMKTSTHTLYKVFCKSDVDVEIFKMQITKMVEVLKVKIPNCERAFNKLLNSTDILSNNYDKYYKEYIMTGNVNIIAENFIRDVADSVPDDASLLVECKRMIAEMRNLISKAPTKNKQDREMKEKSMSLLNLININEEESV